MDEHRLRVFVAVAERLSFSAAARSLHLSQPAVSQQVALLERDLGAALFERTTRRVRLTAAGAALLARASTLLREHAEARRAVAAAEGRIAGDLTVAASLTIGAYVLPGALARLAARHPELRVRVTMGNTKQVAESLLSGRADLGFVEGDLDVPELLLHRLRDDELIVIAAREHRFAAHDEIRLDDLVLEPFVLREEGSGTRQVAEAHLLGAGIGAGDLRVVAELSGIDAIKACVAAGMGVSIISRSAVTGRSGSQGLVARRVAGMRMTRQFAAATLRTTPPLPATRLLIELLAT